MTETQTLTLTDFLLARFAERKQQVASWMPGVFYGHPGDDGYAVSARMEDLAVWVTADCEAKRRIVEERRRFSAYRDEFKTERQMIEQQSLDWVLRQLALPDVDHPDFRQEWRA